MEKKPRLFEYVAALILVVSSIFILSKHEVWAGTDPVPDLTTSTTTITRDLFNTERNAMQGDWVPRNSSGTATDGAGGLGQNALRWSTSYIEEIYLETSGTATLLRGDPVSGGLDRTYLGPISQVTSDTETSGGAPSSYEEWGDLSASITTNGRAVFIGLQADALAGDSSLSLFASENTAQNADAYCKVKFVRDSTDVAIHFARAKQGIVVSGGALPTSHSTIANFPVSSFMHIDTPTAGTYNYRTFYDTGGSLGDSTSCTINNAKLFVYEL